MNLIMKKDKDKHKVPDNIKSEIKGKWNDNKKPFTMQDYANKIYGNIFKDLWDKGDKDE